MLLFVLYLYSVQEAPDVAGLAMISLRSFMYFWHDGVFLPEQVPNRLFSGYRGFFPPGVKRPGLEVDHLPPSVSDVKTE
jgi:hypothetical protein